MSSDLKDWFQVGAWFVAIIGGLIAASKAVAEARQSNAQRREDMRWKRAEMAKICLDEIFGDRLSSAAMKMLDWNNLTYDLPNGGKTTPVDRDARRKALRTSETVFPADGPEQFIRDSFDALFDGFQMLEHYISIGLIDFADVKGPFAYYVKKLSSPEEYPVVQSFLDAYDFDLSGGFLSRFPEWKANMESK
jgi:hypothetical protein